MIFNNPPIILAYHRIFPLNFDPQLLSVSPKNFREQLEVIRKFYTPIALESWSNFRHQLGFKKPGVIITFDDGYADNLHHAKPLLEEFKIPATFFVTTGMINSPYEFWWDELENIFFNSDQLPEVLEIEVNGRVHVWSSLGAGDQTPSSWNVINSSTSICTARQRAYLDLSSLLHPLLFESREKVIEFLFDWASRKRISRDSHKTLRSNEVIELNKSNLMDVGAHSVCHDLFSELSEYRQKEEILTSKAHLETLLETQVNSFAYPYGGKSHYSVGTPDLVRQSGFKLACSNYPGFPERGVDPFQLPRFLVRNWGGEEFSRNLENWFSTSNK